MSITSYNGGAIVAMAGKNCVAIASDKRLGMNSYSTVSTNFDKVFKLTDQCYVGFAGLATDVSTLHQLIRFRKNLFELREEKKMNVMTIVNLMSTMLYKNRFSPYFVTPVIAGLTENHEPCISSSDFIGSSKHSHTGFTVAGTASEILYGVCEAFYRPNLEPEELFEVISQVFMASIDRDCFSGWGAVVHVITPEKVTSRSLKTRMD